MASREGQVGANWAAGSLSIAEEHRASAICERLLAIRSQQPPGGPAGPRWPPPRRVSGTDCPPIAGLVPV